jgi:two-component system, OmpR family, sensor kinase
MLKRTKFQAILAASLLTALLAQSEANAQGPPNRGGAAKAGGRGMGGFQGGGFPGGGFQGGAIPGGGFQGGGFPGGGFQGGGFQGGGVPGGMQPGGVGGAAGRAFGQNTAAQAGTFGKQKAATKGKGKSQGGPKGNNGLGNGIDPQPPGNPPVNDGPGFRPGNPGNRGRGKR